MKSVYGIISWDEYFMELSLFSFRWGLKNLVSFSCSRGRYSR